MNIYTLFPVQILVHDVSDLEQQWIRQQIEPLLDRLEFRTDRARHMVRTTYTSSRVNDIIDRDLSALHQVITESVEYYVASQNSREHPTVFESWFNIYDLGGYMGDHEHPGCKISGIYYHMAEEGSGDLWFRNPNPLMLNHIWPSNAQPTLSVERVPARTGRLVLFPGWLTHSVSTCSGTKISIAFNLR
jgi:uncharacterized protein (TIGR02466 family)